TATVTDQRFCCARDGSEVKLCGSTGVKPWFEGMGCHHERPTFPSEPPVEVIDGLAAGAQADIYDVASVPGGPADHVLVVFHPDAAGDPSVGRLPGLSKKMKKVSTPNVARMVDAGTVAPPAIKGAPPGKP